MSDTLKIYGVTYTGVTSLNANDLNHANKQYIRPEGTKSITANGTGIDVASYAAVDVAVSSEPDIPIFSTDDFETYTCNKTFAECLVLFNNKEHGAIVSYQADTPSGVEERREYLVGYTARDEGGPLRYCLVTNGVPVAQINYDPYGGITAVTPDSLGTLEVTANGTYSASSGEIWNEVNVNVPSSSPSLQSKTKTYTPSATAQSETVTADSGYDGLAQVIVNVEAMPSGTAGTPIATKGTVSNHSVSVTPSVTNTSGYITGSTKTGTAVTVSASELVSGSETKTANGTYNVTNLASLVVAVPLQTIHTGTSAPSSSLGSNGDVYIQTA